MKIFNTLSNQIETFTPIEEGKVKMYVCGPTVYNHAHIGNARPIVIFDTFRRLLEAQGYKVSYVSNFTDVDDKIIAGAKAEGMKETEFTKKYIEAYLKVREDLHTLKLTSTPKVTETMDAIIAFIQQMIDDGYAYIIDGDVYFSVGKIPDYGKLSKQKLEDLQVGARIDENDKKADPLDFVLWKKTDEGIQWDAPWGKGRPGWHTECVVMINNEFKHTPIDIHGGGMDLRFPHHENEMAQEEAVHHDHLANYWMHNGMLVFDGEKMSKSLGNVVLAKDVIERLGSNVTRWLLNSAHYRAPLKFNEEAIEQAQTEVVRILSSLRQAQVKLALATNIKVSQVSHTEFKKDFLEAMNDDLNTPNGYKVVFDVVKQLNTEIRARDISYDRVGELIEALEWMLGILGIEVEKVVLSDDDRALYAKWQKAKAEKDFAAADSYRSELAKRDLL